MREARVGATAVARAFRPPDAKLGRLTRHPLLRGCPAPALATISRACDEVEALPGETIVREGSVGHWLFLVHAGIAEVVEDGRKVGLLGPGQHFGELALLDPGLHPVTVKARTSMTLGLINRRDLGALLDDIPGLESRLLAPWDGRTRGPARPVGAKVLRLPARTPARRPRRRLVFRLAPIAAVATAAVLYHPPLAVIGPGPTYDVAGDITIEGIPQARPTGRYLLTSIRVNRPSALGLALVALRSDREVVASGRVATADRAGRRQRDLFLQSRLAAAAAAARSVGVGPGPLRVRFKDRDVLGPSAGLVYALAIADILDPADLAQGRTIAATGTVDSLGRVGEAWGVRHKAEAARTKDAWVIFLPLGQLDEARGALIEARGVESLREALLALR